MRPYNNLQNTLYAFTSAPLNEEHILETPPLYKNEVTSACALMLNF
jgi:hypothetical protein